MGTRTEVQLDEKTKLWVISLCLSFTLFHNHCRYKQEFFLYFFICSSFSPPFASPSFLLILAPLSHLPPFLPALPPSYSLVCSELKALQADRALSLFGKSSMKDRVGVRGCWRRRGDETRRKERGDRANYENRRTPAM